MTNNIDIDESSFTRNMTSDDFSQTASEIYAFADDAGDDVKDYISKYQSELKGIADRIAEMGEEVYSNESIAVSINESEDDAVKPDKKIEKLLCKLIANEWYAGNMYKLFINACKQADRTSIKQMMFEAAVDELDDHMKSMVEYSISHNMDVPSTAKELKRYAGKEDSKQYENFKKNKDAKYYIEESIKAEKRAITDYEEALQIEEVWHDMELKSIITNNYYDEKEHLETFTFALNQIDAIQNVGFFND